MKKSTTKLVLHRETVRRLDALAASDLRRIQAGAGGLRGNAIISTDNEADCDTHMSGPQ
jgi:hypothetical protein